MDNGEEEVYQAIADVILESVSTMWTFAQREKFIETFIKECKEYLVLPGFIHFTYERMHSSIVHACYESNASIYDFYTSPTYVPAIFYVHSYSHYSYRPEGMYSIEIFL